MTDKNVKAKPRRPQDSGSTALAIPSLGIPSIFQEFMQPFDEFMEPFFQGSMRSFMTQARKMEPVVDFQDRGDHYVVTAELPGFEKKDVEVKAHSNVLELTADKSTENETKGKEGVQKLSSRSYFHRYLTLPEEVLSEKVSGTMKNGVLELRLPKRVAKAADKSTRVDLK